MACIDFEQVAIGPVTPIVEATEPERRERMFHCEHFSVWRHSGPSPFVVGRNRHATGKRSFASSAMASWSIVALAIPSAAATSCSCRRRSAHVPTGHAMQSACWKSLCLNSSMRAGSAWLAGPRTRRP